MSSGFIDCNQCTTLVRDADNRVAFVCLGAGRYGKSLNLPLNFAVTLKML